MSELFKFPPACLGFLLIIAILVLATDLFSRKAAIYQHRARLRVFFFSLSVLIFLFTWISFLYPQARYRFLEGHFIWDPLTALLSLTILAVSILIFIQSRDDLKSRQISPNDYYSLALFSVLGMLVLVSAGSVVSLYLGLELMSLPLYAIVALERQQSVRIEAAMKYIILGAVASAFLLYGFSLLYSIDHSLMLTNLFRIDINTTPPLLMRIGLVFIVVAIAFKLGAAPFHFWAPDVYQGSPVAAGMLIATAPKLAITGMTIRLMLDSFPSLLADWKHLFLIIGLLSVILGNIAALIQTQIKRLLAYSSVAHMGYIVLGFSTGIAGCATAIFYSISYTLMAASAFGILASLNRIDHDIEHINDLKGLHIRNPYLAFSLLLTLLSMAGIPPLLGFMAKLSILNILLATNPPMIPVITLVFSAIGAYYYFNIIRVMYFETPSTDITPLTIPRKTYGILSIHLILLLALGLSPDTLITWCQQAIAAIPCLIN